MDLIWVPENTLIEAHDESIRRFGGRPGIKSYDLLSSALHAPLNLWQYEPESPIWGLAARYGRLTKNHAFHDGNKRAAFMAIKAFILLNGLAFEVERHDAVSTILAFTADEISEDELAEWIKSRIGSTT